ncbi:bifunctional diguanylate cyclase/phosphodiesterase [Imhoffiella purpurea]|nr:bifunctional diguanylate cyclase/phosphodiesterase [Imhoffiella purpurea]
MSLDRTTTSEQTRTATLTQAAASRHRATALDQDAFLARAFDALSYALQPIVNVHTGSVYGFEALLRGVGELGFQDIFSLFGYAWEQGHSSALDMRLRELALAHFTCVPEAARYKLFFNLDPHLIEQERPEPTLELLTRHGLGADSICLELSERSDLTANPIVAQTISAYRGHRFHFAIDDFGSGYAGLRLLYEHPPDLLKIDRFFVGGMAEDHRKRHFVANMVQLAHVIGIQVVAEGVETEAELLACREVGCDLVQGYLIERPQLRIESLQTCYAQVAEIHSRNRRETTGDRVLIERCLERIPPLRVSDSISRLFDAFRLDKTHNILPVLDAADRPIGLVHESDLKDLIYSNYGRDLIVNRSYGRSLQDFVRPCPAIDIHDSPNRFLEAFSAGDNAAGLLVTLDGRYHGFISTTALLQLIDEKNLAAARDQNPLTKLPGNNSIHEYLSHALSQHGSTSHLVYLDFDSFKSFNDHYGFRRGDRVIQMFSELMRQYLSSGGWFIGHIGGDDFFAGIGDRDLDSVIDQVQGMLSKFRSDVQSLYDPEDRERGHLNARDRFGQERQNPLMRCSGAILEIRPGDDYGSGDDLGRIIAAMKCQAKRSPSGLALQQGPKGPIRTLPPTPRDENAWSPAAQATSRPAS